MFRTTLIAATLAVAFNAAHAAQPLTVKVYNADGNSFNVNSALISGEKDAIVIADTTLRGFKVPLNQLSEMTRNTTPEAAR